MIQWLLLVVGAALCTPLLVAQTSQSAEAKNPFLQEWNTPFGVPPFERIKEEHFVPAIKEGIAEQRREIDLIANSAKKPTFANTVEPLDASGELLDKVEAVFSNLMGAETNDQLQAIAREVSPLTSALRDDIMLNEKLFARVKTVWEQRYRSKLSPEQLRLVEETYKDFVRGGANLSPEKKQRLRQINEESSLLGLKFGDNMLKETNAYRLVIEKKEDLAGLPPNVIAAAADAAKAAKLEGKWVFTLQAPSIWPFLTYSTKRELREQILTAYAKRGDNGNDRDNKEVLTKIATLRAERARIMGYPDHAAFVLEERMAKKPDQVYAPAEQALGAGPFGCKEGSRRPAGHDQAGRRPVQAGGLGLALLCRKSQEGPVRPGRHRASPLL